MSSSEYYICYKCKLCFNLQDLKVHQMQEHCIPCLACLEIFELETEFNEHTSKPSASNSASEVSFKLNPCVNFETRSSRCVSSKDNSGTDTDPELEKNKQNYERRSNKKKVRSSFRETSSKKSKRSSDSSTHSNPELEQNEEDSERRKYEKKVCSSFQFHDQKHNENHRSSSSETQLQLQTDGSRLPMSKRPELILKIEKALEAVKKK
ncbi:hypothetical protein TKK_0004700 [Trichogramma kaykai]